MPKTSAVKHVHKYYRLEATGLWHCALCSHYKPGNVPPPVWQLSRCWKCEGPFELTPDNMVNAYPTCIKCNVPKAADDMFADYIDYKTTTFDKPPMTYEEYERKRKGVHKTEEHAPDCGIYDGGECSCK